MIPIRALVVTSLAQALQRWNAAASTGMRGIITILDNASYPARQPSRPLLVRVPAGARLAIVAASWPLEEFPRGVVRRSARKTSPFHRRPHILANIWVTGQTGGVSGRLVLDGLLIEGEIQVRRGMLGKLEIRHCTVGAAAAGLTKGVRVRSGNESLAVSLHHSIVGSLQLNKAAGGAGIFDSIVGEDRSAGEDPAALPIVVDAQAADLDVARSTIFGRCRVRVLEAENSLLVGPAEASHRQEGCVRFCFAPLVSHVARRYRCAPDLGVEAEAAGLGRPLTLAEKAQVESGLRPRFTSSAYPSSAFGQLQLNCSEAIRSGAYGGGEMGAGFLLREPFRRANLDDALQEFLPFGLEAAALFPS